LQRTAIFVDAGYLFAQGSAALTGSSKKRENLVLDAPAVVADLKGVLTAKCPNCSLLRIYWYDGGVGAGRLSADQALLARLDDVKVRLGFINSAGQQKGVDSLIVTDLIELARQKAICDAILLSGDEDVRVGVQIAQNYGVRVHLLGISPSRGSQSHQLLQEADTTTEWDQQTVRRFLSERQSPRHEPGALGPISPPANDEPAAPSNPNEDFDLKLELAAKEFADALQPSEIEALSAYWATARGLPPEIDRRLLPSGRQAIGRDLEHTEKRFIRARVQKMVQDRVKRTHVAV
jgi:uncharacterized LabA/DUF88 family protein